jgi:hypothetical protein
MNLRIAVLLLIAGSSSPAMAAVLVTPASPTPNDVVTI